MPSSDKHLLMQTSKGNTNHQNEGRPDSQQQQKQQVVSQEEKDTRWMKIQENSVTRGLERVVHYAKKLTLYDTRVKKYEKKEASVKLDRSQSVKDL